MKGRSLLKATRRYWFGNKMSLSNEMFAGLGEEAEEEEEEEEEEEVGKPWRGTRSLHAVRGAPRWNPEDRDRSKMISSLRESYLG